MIALNCWKHFQGSGHVLMFPTYDLLCQLKRIVVLGGVMLCWLVCDKRNYGIGHLLSSSFLASSEFSVASFSPGVSENVFFPRTVVR